MKLVAYKPKCEAEPFSFDAFILFGKCYAHGGKRDGIYILLNITHPRRLIKNYVDVETFTVGPMLCFRRVVFRYRKPRWAPSSKWFVNKVWCPVKLLNKKGK